ncbi:MAG: FAD-binding oxidoreductase [Bacteroidota bacterium]
MTRSPWQSPLPPREVDVAVVGGGVIGCATAFALRQADPTLRLAIVEAGRLADGASGRNAGFVLLGAPGADPGADDPAERERASRLWAFTSENAQAVRALDGRAFDLRWTGSVIAAGDDTEAGTLRRQADALGGVEWLGPDALHRRIGGRGFHGGLFVAEGGVLHPAKLVRHLAALSGAAVLERSRVLRLGAEAGGVVISGREGALRAGRVAVCLNAYLPQLLPELSGWVRPVRAQMLATEAVPPVLDVPVYSHDGYFYLRQHADGRLLLGGARHLHRETEVGYEDTTTPSLQASLAGYLADHFPALSEARVVRPWSGTMGFSPDGLPVVGDAPGVPGVTVAAGFTGHGMGYAVRFGQLLARRILGQADPAADLFDSSRLVRETDASARSFAT